jgi:hypothetical protein
VKQRFVRIGDELTDDVSVVVSGGALDPVVLRADALRNHGIYASYGISVFPVLDLSLDELAQLPPLVRFEQLATVTVMGFARSDWYVSRRAVTPVTTTSRSKTSTMAF